MTMNSKHKVNIMKLAKSFIILFLFLANGCQQKTSMPDDFVFLSAVDPTIIENVRYATKDNFLGKPIEGYTSTK